MRIRPERFIAALAGPFLGLALLGLSCKQGPTKQVTVVEGVEVVSNPAMPLHKDPGRVLRLREKLRIRDTGDRFYFKGPHFPDIGPDGSIFVMQIGQLLRFASDGTFLANLITPGQGPSEIEMPFGYLIEGDGILVIDGAVNKVVHMTLEGRYLDDRRLDFEAQALTRGWYVGLQSFRPRERGVLADMLHNLLCASRPEGSTKKTYAFRGKYFDGPKSSFAWDRPIWAVDVGRDLVFFSISRDYGIKVLDLNAGRVVRSFSRTYPKVPFVVNPKSKTVFAAGGAPKPEFEEDVRELFVPDTTLWVRTSTFDAVKGELFDVFSAEGDFLDSFYVRVRGKIIGIRGDTIFVSEEAEDGTLAVVLYESLESGRD